ncbi:hypothetical protein BDV18DRAFT_126160 [Aspergillus unguis]
MDFSKLTRPAVLCQCSRCLSSLAVVENEWAKLSNSYAVVAGWLSIQLHRISISSEKKQIPQTSELRLIRGRIVQEIGCKLCHQKLGVLSAFDNGPTIFWKLSKVSFLEIVTMRTVEPIFNETDSLLENILFPKPKAMNLRPDGTPTHPGALVPTGSNEIDTYDVSVEHQIQQQGLSLDNISTSVSTLHDTMHELKNAFTAMRIELNGPSRFPSDHELANTDFNMVTTVLRELKSKADEIEKLKLEIEALKFRNRYVEEHTARQSLPTLAVESPLPEVATPGLLQGGRKRPYPFPEHYQGGRDRPIPDSFDEDDEDSMADFSLEESTMPSVKIPLRENGTTTEPTHDSTSLRSPRLQIEHNHQTHKTPQPLSLDEPLPKRPRLSTGSTSNPNKRPRGRPPRKSVDQASQPDSKLQSNSIALNDQNSNPSHSTPVGQSTNRRGRSRSLRRRSRASSPNPGNSGTTVNAEANPETIPQNRVTNSGLPGHPVVEVGKENAQVETSGTNAISDKKTRNEMNEKRKAQTAARDNMAKLAMQREEAMDTEAR